MPVHLLHRIATVDSDSKVYSFLLFDRADSCGYLTLYTYYVYIPTLFSRWVTAKRWLDPGCVVIMWTIMHTWIWKKNWFHVASMTTYLATVLLNSNNNLYWTTTWNMRIAKVDTTLTRQIRICIHTPYISIVITWGLPNSVAFRNKFCITKMNIRFLLNKSPMLSEFTTVNNMGENDIAKYEMLVIKIWYNRAQAIYKYKTYAWVIEIITHKSYYIYMYRFCGEANGRRSATSSLKMRRSVELVVPVVVD